MRDVAVVAVAQSPALRRERQYNEVEILMPVVQEAMAKGGIPKEEFGFVCSGSSDYLVGFPFSFVIALDAVGAWPPVPESHVEMDGAWALYEAWVKIQCEEADSALVYAFGRSSLGDLPEVLSLQLDPYVLAPLWPDAVSMSALQARAALDAGLFGERDMAEVAVRSRRDAKANPNAQVTGDFDVDALLAGPYVASPLRRHDLPPITDGAAAIVLAAGDLARSVCERPAWIRGIDHRIDAHQPGVRDLTDVPSARLAAERAGASNGAPFDVAELHAPFTHQELLLRRALGLDGNGNGDGVRVNPSGGPLAANPMMVAGLVRFVEAAQRIMAGEAERALVHATSGPCLQQNLVAVLEGGS